MLYRTCKILLSSSSQKIIVNFRSRCPWTWQTRPRTGRKRRARAIPRFLSPKIRQREPQQNKVRLKRKKTSLFRRTNGAAFNSGSSSDSCSTTQKGEISFPGRDKDTTENSNFLTQKRLHDCKFIFLLIDKYAKWSLNLRYYFKNNFRPILNPF